MRESVRMALQVHQPERARDQFFALRPRQVSIAQAEVDVVAHRLPRKERELLEDHCAVGTWLGDHLAVGADRAGGRRLEARHHPQAGGLAAARRADDRHELLVANLEIDVLQRLDAGAGTKNLVDLVEADRTHRPGPHASRPRRWRSQPSPRRSSTSISIPTTPIAIIPAMTVGGRHIGLRLHHHEADSCRGDDQFRADERLPAEPGRDPQARHDRGRRGRQQDFKNHAGVPVPSMRAASISRGLDEARAAIGVDQAGRKAPAKMIRIGPPTPVPNQSAATAPRRSER
jgi:hypothetical protein